MARLPRLTIPGGLHHVVQRGNNRQPIVKTDADRRVLLETLAEQARQCRVALHAYVLMDTCLHLLATPETGEGVPLMMQALGRRYVRYFNDLHQRSGTLWDGRYRSTVLQAERHLLPAMCYLDLMPVRAGLVAQPRQYPWSSHRHHIGQAQDRHLSSHPVYWGLGNTPFAREAAYAARVDEGLAEQQCAEIEASVMHGWAMGSADFIAGLQQQTKRRVSKARAGRPALR